MNLFANYVTEGNLATSKDSNIKKIKYWNVSLDKNKNLKDGLSEAVYLFLKDNNSDKFSIEPMQIVYESRNFFVMEHFRPKLVSARQENVLKFDSGIDKAIESFKYASFKQGRVNFDDRNFIRPLQTNTMTLVKAEIADLFSYYDYNVAVISSIYAQNFLDKLSDNQKEKLSSDIRAWHNNNVFEVDNLLYYTHFSYRDSVKLEEFKK